MDSLGIVYDILDGNVNNAFDIIKRPEHGMIVGECHSGMRLTMPKDRKLSRRYPSLEITFASSGFLT